MRRLIRGHLIKSYFDGQDWCQYGKTIVLRRIRFEEDLYRHTKSFIEGAGKFVKKEGIPRRMILRIHRQGRRFSYYLIDRIMPNANGQIWHQVKDLKDAVYQIDKEHKIPVIGRKILEDFKEREKRENRQ